jgi:hypothetical protein
MVAEWNLKCRNVFVVDFDRGGGIKKIQAEKSASRIGRSQKPEIPRDHIVIMLRLKRRYENGVKLKRSNQVYYSVQQMMYSLLYVYNSQHPFATR